MKKLILATMTFSMIGAGAALAQGFNANAPQPNSTGTGVTQPMTGPRGEAIDQPSASGYKGGSTATTGSARGNNANSASGDRAAGSRNSNNATQSSGGN